MSESRVNAGSGTACFKCGCFSTRWEHPADYVPPDDCGYYDHWFECTNPYCEVEYFFAVGSYHFPARPEKERRVNWHIGEVLAGRSEWTNNKTPQASTQILDPSEYAAEIEQIQKLDSGGFRLQIRLEKRRTANA